MKRMFAMLLVMLALAGAEARAEGALRVSVGVDEKEVRAGEYFNISYTITNASEKTAFFYLWYCSSGGQWRSNVPRLVAAEPACLRDAPVLKSLAPGDSISGSETFVYLEAFPTEKPVTFRMSFHPAHENMQGKPTELLPVESENELTLRILPGDEDKIKDMILRRRDAARLLA